MNFCGQATTKRAGFRGALWLAASPLFFSLGCSWGLETYDPNTDGQSSTLGQGGAIPGAGGVDGLGTGGENLGGTSVGGGSGGDTVGSGGAVTGGSGTGGDGSGGATTLPDPGSVAAIAGGNRMAIVGPDALITTDGGEVLQVTLVSGVVQTLATGQGQAEGIAGDGTYVYWSNFVSSGFISRAPVDGGAIEPVAQNVPFPRSLAVDSTHVYWCEESTSSSNIQRALKSGGPAELLAGGQAFPHDIALSNTRVFWTTWATNGGVFATSKSGGAVDTLSDAIKSPFELELFGGEVFATADTGGVVVKVPQAGGSLSTLASSQSKPGVLAVDSSGAYWISQSAGEVRHALTTGGPVSSLTTVSGLRSVGVDENFVYYLTSAELVRMAKP